MTLRTSRWRWLGFEVERLRRRARSAILAAVAAAIAPAQLVAQVVRGDVRDERTGQPIDGARIVMLSEGGAQAATGRTTADGRYQLAVPEPGEYRLRCEMPGYRLVISGLIRLAAGQEVEQIIRLTPLAPVTLDTVVAAGKRVAAHLADFHRRRGSGLGAQFLTREEFERWSPGEVTHIVRRLTGFTIRRNNCLGGLGNTELCRRGVRWIIESSRGQRCPPQVVVDGIRVGTTNEQDLNDILWVENLDAVEAYTSAAQLPPELNVTGAACGVLVFWRRR